MKNHKTVWGYIYIIAIGITAFILMIWITPYDAGVSPDSTTYISGAKSILSGKGFSINGSPITHFPPFYPILLAFAGIFEGNLIQAARFLNAFLFGVNASVIALAVYLITKRNFLASICAALFFLSSAQILEVYAWAWSEPLFITLSLAGIILLSFYVIQPTMSLFIGSSLLLGFSLITRYIGMGFLPAGVGLVFLGSKDPKIWKKFGAALIWFVLAISPLGIFLIENLLTSGMATDRTLTYHPIALYEYGYRVYSLVISFFAPISLPPGIRPLILGLLTIPFIILFIVLFKRRNKVTDWREIEIIMILSCLLFISSYILSLFMSISFFDAATPVDSRILSPVLSILILGFFSVAQVFLRMLKELKVRWGVLLLIILSISIKIPNVIHSALNIQENGLGYTSRQWQESESIAFVKSIANNVNIYSNGSDVISFLTEKEVFPIPSKTNSVTMADNQNFHKEIKSMCENIIGNRAILVYLDNIT